MSDASGNPIEIGTRIRPRRGCFSISSARSERLRRPGWLAKAPGRKAMPYRLARPAPADGLLQAVPASEARAANVVPSDQFPVFGGGGGATGYVPAGEYEVRLETDAGRNDARHTHSRSLMGLPAEVFVFTRLWREHEARPIISRDLVSASIFAYRDMGRHRAQISNRFHVRFVKRANDVPTGPTKNSFEFEAPKPILIIMRIDGATHPLRVGVTKEIHSGKRLVLVLEMIGHVDVMAHRAARTNDRLCMAEYTEKTVLRDMFKYCPGNHDIRGMFRQQDKIERRQIFHIFVDEQRAAKLPPSRGNFCVLKMDGDAPVSCRAFGSILRINEMACRKVWASISRS